MNFEVVLISYNVNKFAACNEQVWHFQPVSEEVHLYIDFVVLKSAQFLS